jgi:PKD repeat protein
MKNRLVAFFGVLILVVLCAGCDMIPDTFGFNINANANIQTTSELGDNTLGRIDAVNETIANGLEVGPETRATIAELNDTIAKGVKAGFDEDTLSRVDELLRVVEDGVKIGLDDDTLNTIDGMVKTIDEMPGNWEASASDIIQTLDNTAGSTAKKLADEVEGVMKEARTNYQQMTAITGIEFRCNVDFLGSKVGATMQEFVGKSIVGKLKSIVSGKPMEETVPTPWVCQVMPDTLTLSQVGDKLVYETGVITLTGYNYVEENKPTALVVDESGAQVSVISLYPYLSSPYQIQLNIQDLDFSQVPARSRVVFKWPNVTQTSGIAILLPAHLPPVASFNTDKTSGYAPLTVQFTDTSSGQPTNWEWVFGDGTTSNEQNPSHTFTDSRDFMVSLTVTNSQGQSSVTRTIGVGTQLAADFTFSPSGGDLPLLVEFKDQSTGGATSWLWDFGDEGTSTEQNPQHLYTKTNTQGYLVTLKVENGQSSSSKAATDRIRVMDELKAQFSTDKKSGKPPLVVKFTDQSMGGASIVSWLWDFGDGTTSTLQSPQHTYSKTGNFDVSLTITRGDGKQSVEVKNALINSFTLMFRNFSKQMTSAFKDNSVYFTSFNNIQSGTPLNTGIPVAKYVCGVNGMAASNGVIMFNHVNADGLRVYMFPQSQTWWLIAEFQDVDWQQYYPKETWNVNVACFSKTLEGSVILYREDFRNIKGGTPLGTGIKTDDYFNCGVVGIAGLGATGFYYNTIFPIVLEADVNGSGSEWTIYADMDVADGGDTWNIPVLCLKRGTYQNVDTPPFLTQTVSFQGSITHQVVTDIKASDYLCGVNGYKAERGDIYTIHPQAPLDPSNVAANVLTINAVVKDGYWQVNADMASRYKDEDWTVQLLCVRKPFATTGTPPP